MKIGLIPCPQCVADKCERRYLVRSGELRDDLAFNIVCPNGHKCIVILRAQRFEILFHMGMSALLDGYAREAVSSIAAALERFYEFCTKVWVIQRGGKLSTFQGTWKQLARHSERQYGAYLMLRMLESGETSKPDQKLIEFRNRVIHQGHIPSTDEGLRYAEDVFNEIVATLTWLRPRMAEVIDKIATEELLEMVGQDRGEKVMVDQAQLLTFLALDRVEQYDKGSFQRMWTDYRDDRRTILENRLDDLDDEESEQ